MCHFPNVIVHLCRYVLESLISYRKGDVIVRNGVYNCRNNLCICFSGFVLFLQVFTQRDGFVVFGVKTQVALIHSAAGCILLNMNVNLKLLDIIFVGNIYTYFFSLIFL